MKRSSQMTIVAGCTRRHALRGIGVIAAGAFVLDACASDGSSASTAKSTACGGATCIDLADAANQPLTAVGGAMLLDAASDTIMVIRSSETQVIAVSAICTHEGCSMDYDAGGHRLTCPCHGSIFGEDGRVIRGPAVRAVRVYQATLDSTTITIR